MSISNQSSVGVEAASEYLSKGIPPEDLAGLYVAMKSIYNRGREALESFLVDTDENRITVILKNWRIIYRQDSGKLKFCDLQYLTQS